MFIQAKKKREELRLPILHFVVADDWMDKLGPKAFAAWLKFHTWVDRRDQSAEDIEQAKIPMSMEKVAEKLEISKMTLYRSIIPVLWEYGLIDLVEFQDSKRKTTKPINIIPYDYPQNDKALETKPLEKCRDWKKDYNTFATYYARKEHLKDDNNELKDDSEKKPENVDIEPFSDPCENATLDRNKNDTVDRNKNDTVDRNKNDTVTVTKMLRNNYTNNSINYTNNSINHDSNELIMDEEEKPLKEEELYQFLVDKKIDSSVAKAIVELTLSNNTYLFAYEVTQQLQQMYYEINVEEKKIVDYPVYFLNGIIMQREQRKTKKRQRDLERIAKQREEEQNKFKRVSPVFYNWLEE